MNYFENDFSPALGEPMLPRDEDSLPALYRMIGASSEVLGQSPDAALNGNLPKRWEIKDGGRVLVKAGRAANRFQEPFNELLVTRLCERLLDDGDYVPYALVDEGFPDYLSVCPCMVDANTEFVPDIHLHGAFKRPNDEDLGGFFLRVCREHGVDASTPVEKMVVIDYISANWDRHWNNFGVFIDAEMREWKRVASIFDTGESFWCDRKLAQGFGGYTLRKKGSFRPFMRDVDRRLARYCKDMSWYEPSALSGYVEEVVSVLSQNPLVSNEAGRLEGIAHAIKGRIAAVNRLFELSRKRLTPVTFSVRADAARRAATSAEKSRNADAGEKETRKSR